MDGDGRERIVPVAGLVLFEQIARSVAAAVVDQDDLLAERDGANAFENLRE